MEMIKQGGYRLQRWSDTIKKLFSTYKHDIPPPSTMDIGKLGYGGAITSDTCNSAQKTRRLIVDHVMRAASLLSRS